MNWDEEVDIVCTGSGAGGLATAIAAVDSGLEVFIADSTRDDGACGSRVAVRPDLLHRRFGIDVADSETNEYFDALSSDLHPLSSSALDADVPIRVVDDRPQAELGRHAVAPFVGARLRDWAARCLASPYGMLSTRPAGPRTTTMRTRDGETIEVVTIGSFDPDGDSVPGQAVADWLLAQARDRSIEICAASPLQRLVFEEGEAVGAVFATPAGPRAVRALRGVMVAAGGRHVIAAAPRPMPGDATLRVCLVGQNASRFGRIELLTTEPLGQPAPSTCRSANRRLHENAHQTRQKDSPASRCRKVHGYPPLGQ